MNVGSRGLVRLCIGAGMDMGSWIFMKLCIGAVGDF